MRFKCRRVCGQVRRYQSVELLVVGLCWCSHLSVHTRYTCDIVEENNATVLLAFLQRTCLFLLEAITPLLAVQMDLVVRLSSMILWV
jgi:hypothetical protein